MVRRTGTFIAKQQEEPAGSPAVSWRAATLLHRLMTHGQDPQSAQLTRSLWAGHLSDARASGASRPSLLFEAGRSSVSHLRWRTFSGDSSNIPTGLWLLLATACSAVLVSSYPEFLFTVALAMGSFASVRHPHRLDTTPHLIFGILLTTSSAWTTVWIANRPNDVLFMIAFGWLSVAGVLLAVDSLTSEGDLRPAGSHGRRSRLALGLGALLVSVAGVQKIPKLSSSARVEISIAALAAFGVAIAFVSSVRIPNPVRRQSRR